MSDGYQLSLTHHREDGGYEGGWVGGGLAPVLSTVVTPDTDQSQLPVLQSPAFTIFRCQTNDKRGAASFLEF